MIRSLAVSASLAASLLAGLSTAGAQTNRPVQLIGHYRFLPRFSTLNESGGFAGRDTNFSVLGTFDLWDASRDPLTDGAGVTFRNVDAWASHPQLAYVLDLDETLALSELWGEQLPVMAPFDVYRFTGKTGDGSSVELFAAAMGRWLRLRGQTTPPPGSADFLTYRLHAIARRTPFADFTGDNAVDGSDLATLAANVGTSVGGATALAAGDANLDGIVDGADFLAWQQQLGDNDPPAALFDAAIDQAVAAAAAASVAAAPEPNSATLLIVAAAMLRGAARRRR